MRRRPRCSWSAHPPHRVWSSALFYVMVTDINKPPQFYKHVFRRVSAARLVFSLPIIAWGFRVYNYHQNSGFLMEIKYLIGSCFMCRFMTQQGSWLFGKDIIYYSVIWNSLPHFPGPLTISPPIAMCCTIPEISKPILRGIKKSHRQPGTALAF